jgi:hypothetical protein
LKRRTKIDRFQVVYFDHDANGSWRRYGQCDQGFASCHWSKSGVTEASPAAKNAMVSMTEAPPAAIYPLVTMTEASPAAGEASVIFHDVR